MEASEFIYHLGNCHIYDDHIESLKEHLNRIAYDFPTLEIIEKYDNIEDYTESDFIIKNYRFHETIKMKMRK